MTALPLQPQLTVASAVCAPTRAAALRAVNLSRVIDGRAILHQINLTIEPGEFIALLGANGAGKSTLLSVLSTLAPATEGRLELFGEIVTPHAARLRAKIGMIGHLPMLYRDLSARENLHLFGRLYGVTDYRHRANQLLERVALADRADDPVRTFSRGMTQRIAIARALMHDPQLLLADEPFSGLDIASTESFEQLLRQLNAEGRTIILAHHDLSHSFTLARRISVLRRGRLVLDAKVGALEPEQVRREVLGL